MEVLNYIYQWRKYNYYYGTMLTRYLSCRLFGWTWWDIIDNNIILGAIPLHNLNHLDQIKNQNIQNVLSIVEDFEMESSIYFKPVSKDDWESNGIKFVQISAEDCYEVNLENIHKSLEFIFENIKNHQKTYIHCKAGIGRSASIVLCYMLRNIYERCGTITNNDIIDSYEQLKLCRHQVNINETQFKSIYQYVYFLTEK